MDAQIDKFANTRQDIIAMIGLPAALDWLRTSIFTIAIGSNDFINNYFTPVLSDSSHRLIPRELFVDSMISRFRLQLTVITLFLVASQTSKIKVDYSCQLLHSKTVLKKII